MITWHSSSKYSLVAKIEIVPFKKPKQTIDNKMNFLALKISFRKLLKFKVYTITNLLGLVVGFTAFILIALFIRYELNWDGSNQKYDRIYRVQRVMTNAVHSSNGNNISPHSSAKTAEMIEGKFPEFEKMTVIREAGTLFLGTDDEHLIRAKDGINADSCFLEVFSFEFLSGNEKTALIKPFTLVLSETMAKKLFNSTNVLGRTVILEKKQPFTVTGVYRDLPYNSSLRPPYIMSFASLKPLANIDRSSLWTGDCMKFTLLKQGVSAKQAEDKIRHLFADYEYLKKDELQLCPLSKVYLNFNGQSDYIIILKLFGLIGLFILVMSGFNYINLSLAQSSMRGKEVAVKKVIGHRKISVILQLLTETITISLIALTVAFLFSQIALPLFNQIVDKQIEFNFFAEWKFVVLMVILATVTGLLSGIYPAWFMASSKVVLLFKGNFFNKQREGFSLKKVLVTVQFAISLFLLILTASFSMQIKHLTQKDLGFEKEGLLYSEIEISDKTQFAPLRERLMQHPEINDVSVSKHFPFVSQGGGTTNWEGGNQDERIVCRFNQISHNYLSLLKANIIAGRGFSPAHKADIGRNCIINETAARCFGWKNPIGKRIYDNRLTVVGVVKDFIFHDMHNPVEAGIYTLAPDAIEGKQVFAFRVSDANTMQLRAAIERELCGAFPKDPFEVCDFPVAFNSEYSFKIYNSVNKTLMFFSLLNVLLAVVGMFGLVSFSVARRVKEIGIRKINGSSPTGIFHLLNKEYYWLLIFAVAIASPCAWYAYISMPSANKLPAQPWIFVCSVLMLLVVILLTTSYETLKAATRNPVDALRYE